ncbi:MAG: hypothetical protein AW08_02203 [Candidatus Accumulibacter adjunctus]|uniref:Uncharacterized protein n=1 Tax=Candidatus Accumulibacter adjunctus TaxID=1454001 RepID=A0A011MX24_9PROT|nr:MAG: hypothetical protein AW08_02203 [Candidatus Accumulibacter adjunctus]
MQHDRALQLVVPVSAQVDQVIDTCRHIVAQRRNVFHLVGELPAHAPGCRAVMHDDRYDDRQAAGIPGIQPLFPDPHAVAQEVQADARLDVALVFEQHVHIPGSAAAEIDGVQQVRRMKRNFRIEKRILGGAQGLPIQCIYGWRWQIPLEELRRHLGPPEHRLEKAVVRAVQRRHVRSPPTRCAFILPLSGRTSPL